jgi:ABC-type branched-subunit amino acid transport system substrate-binding protein
MGRLALCLIAVGLWSACSDEDETAGEDYPTVDTQWTPCKVAVVLPMGDGLETHWQQTLTLCADNLMRAFADNDKGVRLQFEWYDEEADELELTARTLANDPEVTAVIGGLHAETAKVLAQALSGAGKPLFTLSTSEELVRGYASLQTVWAMTETDITQCEVLLSRAAYYHARRVALIAEGESAYGKTFVDWYAFQTRELGLENVALCDYSQTTLDEACRTAFASGADCVLCAPTSVADLKQILADHTACAVEQGTAPRLLFSNTAYGSDVLSQLGAEAEGIEGVTYGADPESGFDVSYQVYFGGQPTLGEAQVYDAAMLIGYACYMQLLDESLNFTTAMRSLVDGRDAGYGAWMAQNMREVVQALKAGGHPDIHGASGALDFDAKVYTNVLATVYTSYAIYQGQYITLDYNTSDGSKRTSATLAGWNWKASQMQETDADAAEIAYPALHDRWALLVAASSGWSNYRHQADVLNMYQILKAHGYRDDHIVLIAEDDIAYSTQNPEPGVIRVRPGGENVYQDVEIDYHTSDLSPADIRAILCGERSERLPQVIDATTHDNVLLFWSGHGEVGAFSWLDQRMGFTTQQVRETLEAASQGGKFRKLLCLIETCYSGSVMSAQEGIPGLLALTAAGEDESSKADIYNSTLHVWMTNRFTSTLQDCIAEHAAISMRDLYYRLFLNTVGSHVMLYNADNFGNLYTSTMAEFIEAN